MSGLRGRKGSNPVLSQDEHLGLLEAASTRGRRLRRRLVRDESGQELVEFALSASLVLCLMFAVIEFGYALYSYQFVNEVARDLSRYAIVRGSACAFGMPNCNFTDTNSTLLSYAQSNYNYPGFDTSQLTVTASWYCPSTIAELNPTWTAAASAASICPGDGFVANAPGHMVKVDVTYPFLLSIPFWKATSLTVHSTSSVVISQ